MTAYFMLDFGPDWTATIDLTLLDNGQTRVEIFDVRERAEDDEPTREIKFDADSGTHRELARQACHAIERKLAGGFVVTEYETGRAYGGPEEGGWWYGYGHPSRHYYRTTLAEAETLRASLSANGVTARIGVDPDRIGWPKRRPYFS